MIVKERLVKRYYYFDQFSLRFAYLYFPFSYDLFITFILNFPLFFIRKINNRINPF